jgi:hypothetical protein
MSGKDGRSHITNPTSRNDVVDLSRTDIIIQLRWTAPLGLINREVVDAGFGYFQKD